MDQDILYEILDCQIKKSILEDELEESVSTLKRKYKIQSAFIRSLECNSHMGLPEDELANALIPKDLPSPTDKVYKAVKTTGNGDCLYNSVSLALVGNKLYAMLLRLLVELECQPLRTASKIYLFSLWWSSFQHSVFSSLNKK